MKTLTALTAAAALAAGIGFASAQNSPTSSNPGMKAGSAMQDAAFCEQGQAGSPPKCTFASLQQCQQQLKSPGATCIMNPNKATTGAR
ncbi:MAG: hypothetical protein WCI56_05970 [Hyphomicrobiales bacterium]